MNSRRSIWVLASGAAFFWIVAVLGTYYVVHKPFDIANVLALGRVLTGLGGAALVVALGTGIGVCLLAKVDLLPAERLCWAAALGLGAVSLVGLGLGAVGLLRPWALWLLTLTGLAATGTRLWRAVRDAAFDPERCPGGGFQRYLAIYCGTTLLVSLVWSVTPPTAWDSLVYHLTGPKLYLATGRVCHPLDLPYLGFPQLAEMLFAWSMGLGGERAAAPVHWWYAVLVVIALVSAGRRWLGGTAGWVAASVLLSARTVVLLAGWPYVDLVLLLYTTLAFFALIRWSEDGAVGWLGMSGVLVGLALSTKYTGVAALPAILVALLVLHLGRDRSRVGNLRPALYGCLLVSVSALLVWLPWLVKDLLLTGNPIYPFFFGGIHWDAWRGWWYDRPGTGLAYTSPQRLLTVPWDATIWGAEGRSGYQATMGPLLLALLPLLGLVYGRLPRSERRWLWAAGAFSAVLYGFWLWGVARTELLRQTRLLLPGLGLPALMVGLVVESLRARSSDGLDLGWIVRVVISAVLALALVGTLLFTVREQPLRVLLGYESRDDYLMRGLGMYYLVVEHINHELPPDSVVLYLWEPRSYHCEVECLPDALLDRWLHSVHLHGYDADAIAESWRADGVTHVLLHRAGLDHLVDRGFDPIMQGDLELLETLTKEHLSLAAGFDSVYELYRLER